MFSKIVKSKTYFKRYQVQYRRRREGLTDYRARRRLCLQDRRKYNTPKYRLVVRVTNKDVVCQVIYARITGDFVLCAAYAHELPRYGMPVGLTNYSACYLTGFLLGRRLLRQLKIDDKYKGVKEINGTVSHVEAIEDGPRPFKLFLDTGLVRTSTGARVFSAMKGACDAGLDIPHNEKRFVGYKKEKNAKKGKFDPAILRGHIFGQHVANWMKILKEENPEKFEAQFSRYIKNGITPEKIEETVKKTIAAIRAAPEIKLTIKNRPEKPRFSKQPKKLSLVDRRSRIQQKLDFLLKKREALAASAKQRVPVHEEAEEEEEEETKEEEAN